jgi:hypothetical protein
LLISERPELVSLPGFTAAPVLKIPRWAKEESMKRLFLAAMVFVAISAVAQQPAPVQPPPSGVSSTNLTETNEAPSYSDIYCSGFISKENFDAAHQVVGGEQTPNQALYSGRNVIFVSGKDYQQGARYSVVRALRDPNRYEPYKGQRHDIDETGQPYAQLGQVRIIALRGETAVAEVEFSCHAMTAGDLLIPFQEHPPVAFRKTSTMDRFPSGAGKLSARIVMSNELDFLVARGQKVFINVGSDKGVKVGDYFRAVRGYDPDQMEPVEALSYHARTVDDTQKIPGKITKEVAKTFPERNLGEMIVLNVTPTSSTAMITNSLESIEIGDRVELEGEQ